MKGNYIIERFEDYLDFQSQSLNEAQSDKTGFLAILGSTDNQNLGASAAPEIGIKPDTIYTLTIKGEADLMSLGKNRTYEGFAGLSEGGKSKPQSDFISINSGGKMLEIKSAPKAKGNIIADFDKSGVIEIKASNNGLLAFLRACKAMDEATAGNPFSGSNWAGKLLISMGNPPSNDESRNSSFLSVSPSIEGANPLRYGSAGFEDVINKGGASKEGIIKYINESSHVSNDFDLLFEAEAAGGGKDPGDAFKVSGDSLADAIRAAVWYKNQGNKDFKNQAGLFKAFFNAGNKYRDIVGKDVWEKSKLSGRASYILAVLLQEIFRKISDNYPMNYKFQDLVPGCRELLKSYEQLGQKQKDTLKQMLAFYKPTEYKKIPAFNPVLGEFWDALSNAIIARATIKFKENVMKPAVPEKEGGPGETEGKEKSGKTKYSSGGV